MSPAFLACLLLALFIIVVRGPLILAPEATVRYYRDTMLATPGRVRLFGSVLLVIAGLLIATTFQRMEETMPVVMSALGAIVAIGGCVMVLAPGFVIGAIVTVFFSWFEPAVLRILGIVSVALALLLIYFGYLYL